MGLINSIAKRDRLYFKWKKTVSKGCKSGNLELYDTTENTVTCCQT